MLKNQPQQSSPKRFSRTDLEILKDAHLLFWLLKLEQAGDDTHNSVTVILWKKLFITRSEGHLHPWDGIGSMLAPGGQAVLKTAFQTGSSDGDTVVYGKAAEGVCVLSHSAVSSSTRPHGLRPTWLFRPWDSPGKNAGAGCHFLLQRIFPTQGSNPYLLHLLHWRATLYIAPPWKPQ